MYTFDLAIPFENERHATIAMNSVVQDVEPRASTLIERQLYTLETWWKSQSSMFYVQAHFRWRAHFQSEVVRWRGSHFTYICQQLLAISYTGDANDWTVWWFRCFMSNCNKNKWRFCWCGVPVLVLRSVTQIILELLNGLNNKTYIMSLDRSSVIGFK